MLKSTEVAKRQPQLAINMNVQDGKIVNKDQLPVSLKLISLNSTQGLTLYTICIHGILKQFTSALNFKVNIQCFGLQTGIFLSAANQISIHLRLNLLFGWWSCSKETVKSEHWTMT